MPKQFVKPIEFKQAMAYLLQKQDRPTALKTIQIAALWDKETKRRAFFSARTSSADVLAVLHEKVAAVAAGQGTAEQAIELVRMFYVGDGAGLLAQMGFSPPDFSGPIAEAASYRRLQLIFYQNVKMAQEVGHYRQWMEVADTHPYGRWHIGVSKVHREAHLARDGLVFPFDHPVWTQDPPGGLFNCHCWREELRQVDVDRLGLTPEGADYQFAPSPLGFDPSAGMDVPIPVKPSVPIEIRDELRKALAVVGGKAPTEEEQQDAGWELYTQLDAELKVVRSAMDDAMRKAALVGREIPLRALLADLERIKSRAAGIPFLPDREMIVNTADAFANTIKNWLVVATAIRQAKKEVATQQKRLTGLLDGGAEYPMPATGTPIIRFAQRRTSDIGKARLPKGLAPEAAKAVVDAVEEFQGECAKLGIPGLRGIKATAARAVANMGDGILGLNRHGVSNVAGRLAPSTWKLGDDPKNRPHAAHQYFVGLQAVRALVFGHEGSHHVHQMLGVGTDPLKYKHAPPLEAEIKAAWAKAGKGVNSATRYADANVPRRLGGPSPSAPWLEWFAENRSLYRMGRKDLVDKSPDLDVLLARTTPP